MQTHTYAHTFTRTETAATVMSFMRQTALEGFGDDDFDSFRDRITRGLDERWVESVTLLVIERDGSEDVVQWELKMELDLSEHARRSDEEHGEVEDILDGKLNRMARMFNEYLRVARSHGRPSRVETRWSLTPSAKAQLDHVRAELGLRAGERLRRARLHRLSSHAPEELPDLRCSLFGVL